MRKDVASAAGSFKGGMKLGTRGPGESPRWRPCVDHSGPAVHEFARAHFGEAHRRILLVGGAGFDPRALTVARLLAEVAGNRVKGVFLREERPDAEEALVTRAEEQARDLLALFSDVKIENVRVFEDDRAVGLGRHVIDAVAGVDLAAHTDIVVDFSALSIGSSFPVTRWLLESLEARSCRGGTDSGPPTVVTLHAFVTASPATDSRIVSQPSSVVGPVHGFRGRLDIDEKARAARLWMPQLRLKNTELLRQVHSFLGPHDVVPVLPFPAHEPRAGDRLIEHYAEEFDRWEVDARSIVYADEKNPLDYYRTVLRIHDGRYPVFEKTGGSLLILSPLGSKVLALGGMMAAVERDLPVVYVEALSYDADLTSLEDVQYTSSDLVHVWLFGEAYPPPVVMPPGARGA